MTGEITLVECGLEKIFRLLDSGTVAVTVHHVGDPANHAVTAILQTKKPFFGIWIFQGIDLKIVVAQTPRAVNQDCPDGDVVFGITVQQGIRPLCCIDIVFPEPAFQRPGRRKGRIGVPLLVEEHSPEGVTKHKKIEKE